MFKFKILSKKKFKEMEQEINYQTKRADNFEDAITRNCDDHKKSIEELNSKIKEKDQEISDLHHRMEDLQMRIDILNRYYDKNGQSWTDEERSEVMKDLRVYELSIENMALKNRLHGLVDCIERQFQANNQLYQAYQSQYGMLMRLQNPNCIYI